MAVLGNRGTGLLDMLIEGFRNQGQEVITPFNMSPVDRERTPLQQAMNRPEVMLSQPGGRSMVTFDSGRTYDASPTPQVQAAVQSAAQPMSAQQLATAMPRVTPMQVTPAQAESNVPVNRLIGGQQTALGQGVMQPGMDREKMMRDAKVAKDVLETGDESLIERAKGYFGNRENMVRLALAFNTMRLTPDQGLAAALGSELKDIRANRTTNKTQAEIIKWLQANGYGQYVGVAQQSPKAALEIFKQITQKEFAPGKSPQVSGVQYDADNRAYVVVSENGQPTVKYLGTERDDPIETERLKGQWELSAKRSDEVAQKASTLETQLSQYQQAIQAIRSGAESGVIRNRLPAFDVQTATLRSIAQQLGIGVINSATFGALSEKELELALSTTMDLNLPPAQLEQQIIEKMKATEKLYLEMRRKAAEMASMPYSDYIKLQNERTKENEKFRKLPEGVDESLWYSMTMDEKRAYYEAGQ